MVITLSSPLMRRTLRAWLVGAHKTSSAPSWRSRLNTRTNTASAVESMNGIPVGAAVVRAMMPVILSSAADQIRIGSLVIAMKLMQRSPHRGSCRRAAVGSPGPYGVPRIRQPRPLASGPPETGPAAEWLRRWDRSRHPVGSRLSGDARRVRKGA